MAATKKMPARKTALAREKAPAPKKAHARKKVAKRELVDTGRAKLYVRRNDRGTSFSEVEEVGRSLTQDRRRKAKTTAKQGQGDRGDRRRR